MARSLAGPGYDSFSDLTEAGAQAPGRAGASQLSHAVTSRGIAGGTSRDIAGGIARGISRSAPRGISANGLIICTRYESADNQAG